MNVPPTNKSGERLEIHERCLRDTKNDQLWEAHAEYQGRVGPTVQSYSRKNVRTKARTAFATEHPTKVWRPLLNGEYPPPGPTKLGEKFTENGVTRHKILVYAEPIKRG